MADMRERLIKLLDECIEAEFPWDTNDYIADYLLKNGVIVLPCKVGDKVYELTTSEEIKSRKVKDIIYTNEGFRLRLEPYSSYEYCLNETVFLTFEEAEKALKEREENS